ncbi:MAG: hypothetical protein ACRCYT_07790, partial [Cetobacterium sp.]
TGVNDLKNSKKNTNLPEFGSCNLFAYTDRTVPLGKICHEDYWNDNLADGKYDAISKLSFIKGNVHTGDVIFIRGNDLTGMFAIDLTTGKIKIVEIPTLVAPVP